MQITPIAMPSIDWASFVSEATASLGRSPTRSLDGAGLAPGDLKSYIQALGEFQKVHTSPVSFLCSEASRSALDHLWFSFLFELESPLSLILYGQINILPAVDNKGVFIASATLKAWRDLILNGTRLADTRESRACILELHKLFIKAGFGEVFRTS